MADKDLTVHLKADDNITPVAKKAAAELKKLEKPIEVDADVSGVLGDLDKVIAEMKQTAAAADVLGAALGPELAGQADLGRVVTELRAMGAEFDEITGDADKFAAKLKELADADVGGKLGGALGTTRGKMDEISDSARGANSALANMIGNSTQDLGALSGVAGSAGVALGQLGEYAADAALGGEKLSSSLLSMTKVAAPIAGLALVTKAVADVMARFAASQERTTKSVEMWEEAMSSGGDATEAYADALRDVGEVLLDVTRSQSAVANVVGEANDSWWKMSAVTQIVGKALGAVGDETRDLTPTLTQAQIGVDRWAESVEGGAPAFRKMATYLATTNLTADEQKDILTGLAQAQEDHAKAAANDATATAFFGDETVKATDATKDYHRELSKTEADRKAGERVEKIKAMAAATIAARDAAKEFADTMASADWQATEYQGALSAMSAFSDQLFALDRAQAAWETSMVAMNEAITENGFNFDNTTEAGRKNQAALEGIAGVLDEQLATAYDQADGDMGTFKTTADKITSDTLGRLQDELGLSADETNQLADELGLLPEDIETRYKLSGDEEAKAKIGLLQGSIDALPKDVQTKVTQQIIMGDYQGALATVQGYYNRNPVIMKITPQIQAARNIAVPPGVSAAAAPMAATATSATAYSATPGGYAAPVYTVRAPAPAATITINAGVVGNRFDVDRTVTKALRRHQRLNGRRE